MDRLRWAFLLPGLCLGFLAACATPASRVQAHPAEFARLSPRQQELVRQGEVALGMSPEAVRLALGEPDRVTERIDAGGTELTWHYTESLATAPAIAYPGYYGPWGWPYGPMLETYPTYVERDRVRVIFAKGLVSAVERETP